MFIELRDDMGITAMINTDHVASIVVMDWGHQSPHRARVNVVWADGQVDRDLIVPGVDKPTSETAHRSVYDLLARLRGEPRPEVK